MSHESATPPKANSQGQQESTSNSQMDFEKILDACTKMMSDGLKLESDRHTQSVLDACTKMMSDRLKLESDIHTQSMTTVLTKVLKTFAIAIQNPNTPKMVTEETEEQNKSYSQNTPKMVTEEKEEQNKNYSQNTPKLVTEETEEQNKSYNQNEGEKKFYDTSGKRGLLIILQFEDSDTWEKGNENDLKVLKEFFEATLGFEVWIDKNFNKLIEKLKATSLAANNYYCLMICISGHGDEDSVEAKVITFKEEKETIERVLIQIANIKAIFSNKNIEALSGVPKVIIIDSCRGDNCNRTVPRRGSVETKAIPPTTDSDLLLIHATTLGHVAAIPETGSVGIQGVMKALKANWKNDHLEEMLIDARKEVAQFYEVHNLEVLRQTLETQSTLTERLKFVKSNQ